jgi:hypothetical protein
MTSKNEERSDFGREKPDVMAHWALFGAIVAMRRLSSVDRKEFIGLWDTLQDVIGVKEWLKTRLIQA